jgi:hypothetical protein
MLSALGAAMMLVSVTDTGSRGSHQSRSPTEPSKGVRNCSRICHTDIFMSSSLPSQPKSLKLQNLDLPRLRAGDLPFQAKARIPPQGCDHVYWSIECLHGIGQNVFVLL